MVRETFIYKAQIGMAVAKAAAVEVDRRGGLGGWSPRVVEVIAPEMRGDLREGGYPYDVRVRFESGTVVSVLLRHDGDHLVPEMLAVKFYCRVRNFAVKAKYRRVQTRELWGRDALSGLEQRGLRVGY